MNSHFTSVRSPLTISPTLRERGPGLVYGASTILPEPMTHWSPYSGNTKKTGAWVHLEREPLTKEKHPWTCR